MIVKYNYYAYNQYRGDEFKAADKMLAKLHTWVLFFPGSYLTPFTLFPHKNRQILTLSFLRVNSYFVTYSVT